MPPPRFDPDAETWQDICPWCGAWETHQVGTELREKVVVWCRSCSGSSWLHRGADFLVPRTPPKFLHDKRRPRPRVQKEPLVSRETPRASEPVCNPRRRAEKERDPPPAVA